MKQIFLMSQCQYTRLGLFELIESTGEHAVQVISVETPSRLCRIFCLTDTFPGNRVSLWWT